MMIVHDNRTYIGKKFLWCMLISPVPNRAVQRNLIGDPPILLLPYLHKISSFPRDAGEEEIGVHVPNLVGIGCTCDGVLMPKSALLRSDFPDEIETMESSRLHQLLPLSIEEGTLL